MTTFTLLALLFGCPTPTNTDCTDSDGDGVCNDDDLCTGDDATGDTDADGVCDPLDVCDGNDAFGDTDGDGSCDDTDLCFGDDTTGDTDSDGECDDTDLCEGVNDSGDSDSDGVCDDIDPCPKDNPDDTDGDGVCDDDDPCPNDDPDDSDGDGVCDDVDVCPGAIDESDGSCTMVLKALSGVEDWGQVRSLNPSGECPPTAGGTGSSGHGDAIGFMGSSTEFGTGFATEGRVALSFETSTLPATPVIVTAKLVLIHGSVSGDQVPIQAWGGDQPLFGPINDYGLEAYSSGTQLLDTVEMSTVLNKGFAEFAIDVDQISNIGRTGFLLRLDHGCPHGDSTWRYVSPDGDPADVPTLTVEYNP